jgi:predicted secreted Zn-dependent protease
MRIVFLALLSSACVTVAPARTAAPCAEVPFPADVVADYYDITGSSSSQLRAQMDVKGPENGEGRRNDAYTRYHVNWRYPFHESAAGCSTGPVTVTLKTTYQFPRWVDEASGDGELRRRWQCYVGALLTHEEGHRVHGHDAKAEVEAKLMALPARPTCP